jgi:hypothetical protein
MFLPRVDARRQGLAFVRQRRWVGFRADTGGTKRHSRGRPDALRAGMDLVARIGTTLVKGMVNR